MDAALKSMNLEKVTFSIHPRLQYCVVMLALLMEQVATIMDQFERQFEHLDVQTQTMDEAMSGVTTLTIPEVSPPHFHPPPFPLTPLPV